jgi:hypothetical protein
LKERSDSFVDKASRSKITGKVLAEFGGLTLFGKVMKPKRRGKIRVLIQIRAGKMGDLHVSQCLSYTRGVDIRFETQTTRNSAGQIV